MRGLLLMSVAIGPFHVWLASTGLPLFASHQESADGLCLLLGGQR